MSISVANKIKSIAGVARIFLEKQEILKLITSVDYVAIFPTSNQEHDVLERNLIENGEIIRTTSTGQVFKLNKAINTELGIIDLVRLRIYDQKMSQVGYVDCQTNKYEDYKNSFVGKDGYTITHNSDDMEMVMLSNKDIIVYFPSKPYELKS